MEAQNAWEESRQAQLINIVNNKGQLTMDSREVARLTGKEHSNLMRDIRGYVDIINKSHSSNLNSESFFIESTYLNSRNQIQPCYLLTRKGCDMVANKMTGEKGVIFTAQYVTAFENMEQQLKDNKPKLSKELQAIFTLDERTVQLDNRVQKLEDTMTIDYEQQEQLNSLARSVVVQALGGKGTPAYKELNKKAFSSLWKDYKRVMRVNSYKNTAVKEFDKARDFIEKWQPSRDLELMIAGANLQIEF